MKKLGFYFIYFLVSVFIIFKIFEANKLYLSKPSGYVWDDINQDIYQKSSKKDAVIFTPEWLAGYATDFGRMKYLSIFSAKKITSTTQILPESIWTISLYKNKQLVQNLVSLGYQRKNKMSFDTVTVEKYEKNKSHVIFDYGDNILSAKSWIENNFGVAEFSNKTKISHTFTKIPHDWFSISIQNVSHSFGQETRNAIWFHPSEKYVKKLLFENIPLGDKLVVEAGLSDSGRQYQSDLPVIFIIFVNNAILTKFKIDEMSALQDYKFDLDELGKIGTVLFQVESPNGDYARHIFFRAYNITNSNE